MHKLNTLSDDIWALHKSAMELMEKSSDENKKILQLIVYGLEIAGAVEASNAEKLRKANESFREWCKEKGQFP